MKKIVIGIVIVVVAFAWIASFAVNFKEKDDTVLGKFMDDWADDAGISTRPELEDFLED